MTLSSDYALIGEIVKELQECGSWCGETHIQKTAYVAREVLKVPLSSRFILYKHGPYSFDLSSTLSSMRADRVLSLAPQGQYGSSYSVEPAMAAISEKFRDLIQKNSAKIQKVSAEFASKNVAELERIATAIFVTLNGNATQEARAAKLHKLKPHIGLTDALEAIKSADHFLAASKN